jgi:hypothetical protein
MKTLRTQGALVMAGLIAAAALLAGCSKSLKNNFLPDIPPTVTLTSAPYDTTGRYFYAYKLNWLGNDPDGRVVSFVYAIDPHYDGVLNAWVPKDGWTTTTKNEQIIFFRASLPDSTNPLLLSSDFHVFAIRAVDDRAETSDVVTRSFFSYTVAPSVHILQPRPSGLLKAFITPSVSINWNGQDPDGQFTQKPVKYKFKLISASSQGFSLTDLKKSGGLDSLRAYYAPTWAGWDSTSAETTNVKFTNLTPGAEYVFALIGIDEAGAYTPTFSYDSNLLDMIATLASANGPHITMFNEFFQFTYNSGSYTTAQSAWVPLEVPYNVPITFNWSATSDKGADIAFYRWRLGGDVSDETPRSNENLDITHWSSPSIGTVSATIPAFPRDSITFFYIEATDVNGLKSLGVINLHVVKPTFEHALGIVNDSRYPVDVLRIGTTQYAPPGGAWPTAAEFDTFLFARGGKPYRGYTPYLDGKTIDPSYPLGTPMYSQPGIFQGYDFDTVTTRTGRADLTVPLSELGKFTHIIWICDANASAKTAPGSSVASAMCSLRYMNNLNKVNTLATYLKQGGQVWALGSGVAHACQVNFDKDGNAGSYYADGRELIPGRFMYDCVHWQNNIDDGFGTGYTFRKSPRAIGGPPFNIDYSRLPDTLRYQSLALGDSMPLNRSSGFYYTDAGFSQLSQPNRITENIHVLTPRDTVIQISTLDTLMNVVYPGVEPRAEFPTVTYYHGSDQGAGHVLFTPIDLWRLNKADFISYVDWVVQDLWLIPKNGTPSEFAAPAAALRRVMTAPPSRGAARTLIQGGGAKRILAAPGARPKE